MLILTCTNTAFASTDYLEGHWGLDTERTLYFGTENGSYIKLVTATVGTTISLSDIISERYGYIFDVWYSEPRTKKDRVTEFTKVSRKKICVKQSKCLEFLGEIVYN